MQNKKSSLCINALPEGGNTLEKRYQHCPYIEMTEIFPPVKYVIPQI